MQAYFANSKMRQISFPAQSTEEMSSLKAMDSVMNSLHSEQSGCIHTKGIAPVQSNSEGAQVERWLNKLDRIYISGDCQQGGGMNY